MKGAKPWRVVWVTGASSGIGLEIARALAAEGVKVAASSRKPSVLSDPNVTYFPLDVRDEPAVAACVREIESTLGPIDLAILAAGAYEPFSSETVSAQAFAALNAVNYLGVTNCVSALINTMKPRRRGHISWISSVAGYRGLPKAAYYGPTKAALINLAECLKPELEPHGITVSVINPGFVSTPMTEVNDFKMPFLITPQFAARQTLHGLTRMKFEIAYPAPFVAILKFLGLLPNALYFAIMRRIGRS